ncbi:MAG: 4Fe-4S dicluster domain-containing protein, partial [Deferrisomatales bacterium]
MTPGTSHPTLAFRADRCDGCDRCVEACVQAKSTGEEPAQARLALARDPRDGSYALALCRQCADPRCAAACPAGALRKDPETGVVGHDDTRCVDCRLCTLVCESGGTVAAPPGGTVLKCDLCGGDPACVRACDRGALTHE